MACCKCFPDKYRMIRYEEIDQVKKLYFEIPLDASKLSRYDLELMPKIHNINGVWRIHVESENLYRLVYSGMVIKHAEDPPDETFYYKEKTH